MKAEFIGGPLDGEFRHVDGQVYIVAFPSPMRIAEHPVPETTPVRCGIYRRGMLAWHQMYWEGDAS